MYNYNIDTYVKYVAKHEAREPMPGNLKLHLCLARKDHSHGRIIVVQVHTDPVLSEALSVPMCDLEERLS